MSGAGAERTEAEWVEGDVQADQAVLGLVDGCIAPTRRDDGVVDVPHRVWPRRRGLGGDGLVADLNAVGHAGSARLQANLPVDGVGGEEGGAHPSVDRPLDVIPHPLRPVLVVPDRQERLRPLKIVCPAGMHVLVRAVRHVVPLLLDPVRERELPE